MAPKPMSNEEYNAKILQFMNESRARQGLPPLSSVNTATQQQESSTHSNGSSMGSQLVSTLGKQLMSGGKGASQGGTSSSPFSSLFGGSKASPTGSNSSPLSSLFGGSSTSSSNMTGPYMFDTGTGQPIGSSMSGSPQWTSSGMPTTGGGDLASAANYAVPAAGAAGMYDTLSNERHGWKGAGEGALSGAAMFYPLGPIGMIAGAAIGGTAGYFGDKGWNPLREDTKTYQKRRWINLSKNNPAAASMLNVKQAQMKDPNYGTWQTGKYAGQKWTFEKAADLAKDDPSIFRNEFGNLNTFGNDWNKYNDTQKDAITKALLGENLYESKRGLIKIKDEGKAKEIAAKTVATFKPTSGGETLKNVVKNALGAKKDAKAK